MKKLLMFILGICLIVPSMFVFSACEKDVTSDTWDGTTESVSKATNGVITIETAEELAGLAREVNSGETFEGITIKLESDMDMSNRPWTPIGVGNRSDLTNAKFFSGTFDGNGKKIKGLTNNNYIINTEYQKVESDFEPQVVKTYQYGFFGLTENATIKDLTLSVNFVCENENGDLKGDSVGGLVGFANKGLTIENCVVDGLVTGYDAIGGIVGRAYNNSEEEKLTITNSTNNARVEALYKGAGILGYLNSNELHATISNCENNGDVDVEGLKIGNTFTSRVAGIVTYGWSTTGENTLVITNNTNNGRLNCASYLELEQELSNYHAYAYIGNCVGHSFNKFKHNYNFLNNENEGELLYLDAVVPDEKVVDILLNQSYPPYSEEFDDKSWNITSVETVDELKSALDSETNLISLKSDLDLKEVNNNSSLMIDSGKYILDLNGHKITGVDNPTIKNWHAIFVRGETTELTIADSSNAKTGTIEGRCYGIQVSHGAKLTIDGGNFVCTTNGTYNQSVVVYGGELVVNGGVFTTKVYETIFGQSYTWDEKYYTNKITINGGEFNYVGKTDSNYALLYFDGDDQTVTINGGKFNNNEIKYIVLHNSATELINNAGINSSLISSW